MSLVLLGVTGCIAAYKSCEVVRGLQKAGHDVKVVMTEHAREFVGATTFRALTGHEVAVGLFDNPSDPIHHISLAKEPDVFLIVPATANVVAKIAQGVADDLLTTTALATEKPLIIAPAMNAAMWADAATQQNIRTLESRGVSIVSPSSGYLACGEEGEGRLEEPSVIVEQTLDVLSRSRDMAGTRVLITAGPTQEPLDPVRYITNGSSGLSGYALAAEALSRGAEVTLVSGPVSIAPPKGADFISVRTAREMLDACREPFVQADIAMFVAAVSDWRPQEMSPSKIKHDGGNLELTLVPNPDIAATLSAHKRNTTVVVYAAETGNPLEAAKKKLEIKNADYVVANDVSGELGMGSTENHVWLLSEDEVVEFPTLSKRAIARKIFDKLL